MFTKWMCGVISLWTIGINHVQDDGIFVLNITSWTKSMVTYGYGATSFFIPRVVMKMHTINK
jgi:hypothetical protein